MAMTARIVSTIFFVSLLLTADEVFAQTLSEVEHAEKIDRQADAIKQAQIALGNIENLVDAHNRIFRTTCIKATGAENLCGCLSANIPIAFDFFDYVAIVGRSREENQYAKMDKQTQKAYGLVGPARDKCVASVGKR